MIINIQFMKNLWNPEKSKGGGGGCFPSCLNVLQVHAHSKHTESTIKLLWRNIKKILIYIEKGSISCFICVVSLFNEARKVVKTVDFPAFIYCGSRSRVNSNHVIYILSSPSDPYSVQSCRSFHVWAIDAKSAWAKRQKFHIKYIQCVYTYHMIMNFV